MARPLRHRGTDLLLRAGRWLRPPRRLRVTREGKYFLAITVGIGFAAINTGNNLLYLLLGWMLSMIVASGVLSEQSLRGLRVARRPPARVHAGRPFLMGISLTNIKRRLPSFSIEIEDLEGQKALDKKCYFLKIPAGRTQTTSYRHVFSRRGVYRFDGFRISTRFPFALFRKSRDVEAPGEVIVFPAIRPIRARAPSSRPLGEDARAKIGRRGEFFGLREWREGDDPRDVHWRSSAHKGRLMIREYEEEEHRRATIVLDDALPASATDADLAAFEEAIETAASLAAAWIGQGYAVRLLTRRQAIPPATGQAQLLRILRALALLEPASPDTPWAVAPPAVESVRVGRGPDAPRPAP